MMIDEPFDSMNICFAGHLITFTVFVYSETLLETFKHAAKRELTQKCVYLPLLSITFYKDMY